MAYRKADTEEVQRRTAMAVAYRTVQRAREQVKRLQRERESLVQQQQQMSQQLMGNWASGTTISYPSSNASLSSFIPDGMSMATLGGSTSFLQIEPPILSVVGSKIHNETGPAVYLEGGRVLYFWRGVHVPGWIITNPERITPKRILHEVNLEIRRIMLERYGIGKFLLAFDATEIHRDKRGILWEIDPTKVQNAMSKTPISIGTTALDLLAGQVPIPSFFSQPRRKPHPLRFVQVKDASSDREYFMGVPRKCKTATGAIAWTFGMTKEEYDKALEEEA